MVTIEIPEFFRQNVETAFGKNGKDWISSLPTIVEKSVSRWNLKAKGSFENLSYNFVLPVELEDHSEAVLKIGVDSVVCAREVEALRYYAGDGVVQLLEANADDRSFLIERAKPGKELKDLFLSGNDLEAVELACTVMKQLLKPRPNATLGNLETVSGLADIFARFLKSSQPPKIAPTKLLKAVSIFQELDTQILNAGDFGRSSKTFLHGDLHHSNILSSTRQPWLAIDPKGFWGDPAYEVGAFIRNPMPEILAVKNLDQLLLKRLQAFSRILSFDIRRIWGWAYIQAILAACWSIEDNSNDWPSWIRMAEVLESVEARI